MVLFGTNLVSNISTKNAKFNAQFALSNGAILDKFSEQHQHNNQPNSMLNLHILLDRPKLENIVSSILIIKMIYFALSESQILPL